MKFRVILSAMLFVCVFSISVGAADQVFFYHTDPAGTPLAMTNSSGAVVWKTDYKPFGEEYSITGSAANNKRFVGKEKDEETGLSYFGARYEDAKTGRFIAVDPVKAVDVKTNMTNEKVLVNPQRLNSYAYASNNPYKFVDPDGRDFIYIIDKPGVKGFGHAAAIVGPIEGNWYYDSYGKGGGRAGQQEFTSESKAMDFAKSKGYTDYAKWFTDENASKRAQSVANQWMKGFDKTYKNVLTYIFVGNNCETMVNEMGKAADLDAFIPRGAPNWTFNRTKQGADIEDKF